MSFFTCIFETSEKIFLHIYCVDIASSVHRFCCSNSIGARACTKISNDLIGLQI